MSKKMMVEKILGRFDEKSFAVKMASVMRQGYTEDEAVECIYYSIFDPQKAKEMAAEKRRKQMQEDMRKMAQVEADTMFAVALKKLAVRSRPMTEADYM